MSDDRPAYTISPQLAAALKALRTPHLLHLARCESKEDGTMVTTLCILNEKNGRLRPFAVVPALDLRQSLKPPKVTIRRRPLPPSPADPSVN